MGFLTGLKTIIWGAWVVTIRGEFPYFRNECGKIFIFLCNIYINNNNRSVYERVINNNQRTNNYSESGHKRLQKEMCVEHPTIWKFIISLRSVQKNRDKAMEEFVRGDNPTQKRKKFREIDDKVYSIVINGFEVRTMEEYLRGISSNFNMDK
jgi:hypothetical protein